MKTFRLSKPARVELNNRTVYAVRDPNQLFRYFGKDNCVPVKRESAYLAQLKQHSTLVPVLYYVQGAHVIDDLAAVFIRGLVACFEGNTLFVYDLDTNAYINEIIEAESKMYVVLKATERAVEAVEMQRNSYTKAELLNLLGKLRKTHIDTVRIEDYAVLGHFLQQKYFR
ncbi:hypothetical protein HNP12_000220 [Aeromonas hydrophila]|uniref:hypothetical protein n=1 Tax=Aeromonas hydrophila TaxID=644 RepID=UPI002168F48A|nr:hypothetical protein [Aeromonas hydrophila]MCS3766181.1 hypothetical protein [Aeromonas hydrophila]